MPPIYSMSCQEARDRRAYCRGLNKYGAWLRIRKLPLLGHNALQGRLAGGHSCEQDVFWMLPAPGTTLIGGYIQMDTRSLDNGSYQGALQPRVIKKHCNGHIAPILAVQVRVRGFGVQLAGSLK